MSRWENNVNILPKHIAGYTREGTGAAYMAGTAEKRPDR